MQITRRDAFLGTAAAVAVAAVPTVAQAATGPTEVERLYAELRAAEVITLGAINANEPVLVAALKAATTLLPERPPLAIRLEQENDAAWERVYQIQTTLLETPAKTIRDILLKLLSEQPEGRWKGLGSVDGIEGRVAVAVYRDLERLAGEARP